LPHLEHLAEQRDLLVQLVVVGVGQLDGLALGQDLDVGPGLGAGGAQVRLEFGGAGRVADHPGRPLDDRPAALQQLPQDARQTGLGGLAQVAECLDGLPGGLGIVSQGLLGQGRDLAPLPGPEGPGAERWRRRRRRQHRRREHRETRSPEDRSSHRRFRKTAARAPAPR